MIQNTIIQVQNVFKSFRVETQDVPVLRDISLEVKPGDFLIIYGPSGCGKSTLLHTLLGLEPPTAGKVAILGEDIYNNRTEDDRSEFRKKHIGMVYQQPNWIKALTVLENTAFPLSLLGEEKAPALEKAGKMLEAMEMIKWADYMPSELSSGQQQKVAFARALITEPQIVIADEPTGNLDSESGLEMMNFLLNLNKTQKKTILMVTHELDYLKFARTTIKMADGKIIEK